MHTSLLVAALLLFGFSQHVYIMFILH